MTSQLNPQLRLLQPYPFERLKALLAGITPPADRTAINLHIGEPRHTPPEFIARTLFEHAPELGQYPSTAGTLALRSSIAAWLQRRFQLHSVTVNPDTMVLPVAGTREALFGFTQAIINRNTQPLVVMPNPFYQIYEGAALLASAEPYYLNTTAQHGYLPDLEQVPAAIWNRCQLLFLCSPGNPTGAVMSQDYLKSALALAARFNFVIAADECYSEIYPDESNPPPGLLQAAQAAGHMQFEHCMVFHSLSKRSSVPGLRSGFVAGEPNLIKSFLLYRTYQGCALPLPTQAASAMAWQDEQHVMMNRALYREKFQAILPLLAPVMDITPPAASFYLWPQLTHNATDSDTRFARDLYQQQHVLVLPGSYLSRATAQGNPGQGRLRISLVASLEECCEAAQRISHFIQHPPS